MPHHPDNHDRPEHDSGENVPPRRPADESDAASEPGNLDELDELNEPSDGDTPHGTPEPLGDDHTGPANADARTDKDATQDHAPGKGDDGEEDEEEHGEPDEPPEPLSPDEQRRARVLWALVLGLTALSFVWHHWPEPSPQATDAPAPDVAITPFASEPDPQFMLTSRLSVAMNQLGEMLPAFETEQTRQRRVAELREIADDEPIDQLRVAIVAGELTGTDAALSELDGVDVDEDAELAADVAALRMIYEAVLEAIEQTPSPAAAHGLPVEYDPGLDAEQRQRLIERHGWFARLALTHRQPLADDQRARVLSEARQALWTLSGFMLLTGFALITGTVLLIVAMVMRTSGTLRPTYRRPRHAHLPLLETMAVFLGLMVVGGAFVAGVRGLTGMNLALLLYLALAVALLWPLLRGMDWPALRRAMGWHRGEALHAEAGWSLLGYLAGMPIIAVGFFGTLLLASFAETQATHPAVESLRAGGLGTMLVILLLAVVWAPLVEESLFRGALYHHLRHGWGPIASALGTGVLFALVHPQGWTAVPALASVGVVLAMIREWRGSLIGPICVHAFHNLMILTLAFMLLR